MARHDGFIVSLRRGSGRAARDTAEELEALRRASLRFDAVTQATGEAVWDWDLHDDVSWHNAAYRRILGADADDLTLESWHERIHPEDRERVTRSLFAASSGVSDEVWGEEYRLRRDDGTYAWVIDRGVLLYDDEGQPSRMVGTIRDVTDLKETERRLRDDLSERITLEQQARYLATHDHLTGLANANALVELVDAAISKARATGRRVAVLDLDVDRFKVINDGYGHPYGDLVLQAMTARLQTMVRAGDTLARHGGDEFLILLSDVVEPTDAYEAAQRVIESLSEPFVVEGREIHASVSIGVAVYPDECETADELIDNADVAMYHAKEAGRRTYQVFEQSMAEATQRRLDLETRLRAAAASNDLSLAFQPKLDLKTGTIVGCEALLRWNDPVLGSVSPAQFIPVAEDSGLIVPIGDWALRTACSQARAWQDSGLPPLRVAVNLSARQFLQQDVVAWVTRTLSDVGLSPEQLELELTESLIAQDIEKVIRTISELRSLGVKIAIDDFGTGYSNLSYLTRFRVDVLKIDQAFVRTMLTEKSDAAIVRALISLAHDLDLRVVAEGVESEAEREYLARHGCDEIQGYLISKPVPADEFQGLLSRG